MFWNGLRYWVSRTPCVVGSGALRDVIRGIPRGVMSQIMAQILGLTPGGTGTMGFGRDRRTVVDIPVPSFLRGLS